MFFFHSDLGGCRRYRQKTLPKARDAFERVRLVGLKPLNIIDTTSFEKLFEIHYRNITSLEKSFKSL